VVVLASGLRLEIPRESDKKKMNFIFQLRQKNFLDWENEARVSSREQKTVCCRNFVSQPRRILNRRNERFATALLRSRVDRIRLCAQFLASPSGA
jgi:hypothetical protein